MAKKDKRDSGKKAPDKGESTVVTPEPRSVGETVGTPSATDDTGSGAAVTTPTATPVEALSAPAGSPTSSRGTSPSTALARVAPADTRTSDDVAEVLLVPLRVARRVLPTQRTTVALGVGALALLGALDWPAAVGLGLGWEALRRWGPDAGPDDGRGR